MEQKYQCSILLMELKSFTLLIRQMNHGQSWNISLYGSLRLSRSGCRLNGMATHCVLSTSWSLWDQGCGPISTWPVVSLLSISQPGKSKSSITTVKIAYRLGYSISAHSEIWLLINTDSSRSKAWIKEIASMASHLMLRRKGKILSFLVKNARQMK